jgi:hypothetical protein
LCPACQADLQGGFAKVNITPPLGIPLIGSKGQPSDAILDDLFVKAMVLRDGQSTIAIVSADLLYTPLDEITNPVGRMICEKTGIPETHVMICATHTHSGPEVFALSKFPPEQRIPASKIDQSYLGILIRKIADSVLMANKNMQSVKIGLAKGQLPELVFNRRTKIPDGSIVMTWSVTAEVAATQKIQTRPDGVTTVSFSMDGKNPDLSFGPVESEVAILRVEDANDRLVGSILNFACHPVCIYPSMPTTLSADYPGDATNLVEEIEGGICLFTLGTAGDMVPYQRGLDAHRQLGRALGAEAVRRLQFVKTSEAITVDAIQKEVVFPAKNVSLPGGHEKSNEAKEMIRTVIQILRIGDLYILGLPGEVLAEVGMEIRKRASLEKLIMVSMGNDIIGYICHNAAYDEGGYEPGTATYLEKGAGEIMVNESLDVINRIKQK